MGFDIAAVITFAKAVFGFASAGSGVYFAAVQVARLGVLALSAKLTTPKLDLTTAAFEKNLTVRDTVAPQKIVYGEDMVSGPILYANVAGTDNKDLYFLIGLAGHEIDSFTAFRIDDTDIALGDLSGTEDGTVDAGKYSGVAEVEIRKGTSSQAVISLLSSAFASEFTAAHTGRGWALMCWKFSIVEGSEDVFESGVPANMRGVIRGKKVYDPRLDSTHPGGSGLHRVNDPSTWAWSDNPALCWADFMIDDKFGMREDPARINYVRVEAAADICEQTVTVPVASTQQRYTCNASFYATEKRGDVEAALRGSMLGRRVFSQGQWQIWAGAALTPDVTLTEANLAGGIQVQASTTASQRYNRVRGKFIDADRQYTAQQYVEQRSSTYVTDDGGEVRELVADFLHTNNEYEAQRKAIITLKQSRNQRIVTFEGNFSCFRIQPGTTVSLDIDELGFASDKFFVSEWKFGKAGIALTLVQETDSVWTDPAEGDYSTRTETGAIVFGETGVPAPTGLTATGVLGGIRLNWTNPSTNLFQFIDVYESATSAWAGATKIASVRANTYTVPHDGGETYYYWLRATKYTTVSDRLPDSDTSTITATVPAGGADGDDALALNYTNNSHSVPVTNLGVETWTGSGGQFFVFEGTTLLTLDTNAQGTAYPTTPGEFRLDITKVSGDTLTEPAITGATTTTATLADWASDLTTATVYRITAYILTAGSVEIAISTDVTLSPSFEGDDGTDGTDGDDAFTVSYTNNSHAVPVTNLGVETWTGSGGLFYAYEGGTVLTLNTNTQTAGYTGLTNGEYNLDITKISGDTLTEPAITGATTTTATLADWASNLTTATVYRVTAYIQGATGTQVTLTTDITLTPGDQGADGTDGTDGTDGDPGLPGAGKICLFDDADTGLSSTSAGKYGFAINTTTGTLTWATIVDGTSILYMVCPNLSTGSVEDYEDYFGTIQAGDVITWYDADAFPGRWVSWRITGVGVAITGGYRFPVSFITHFDNGDTNPVPGTAANDIEMRFSRPEVPGGGVAIGDIDDVAITVPDGVGDTTGSFRVDSDGDYYRDLDGAGYGSQGTWDDGVSANTKYEVRLSKISGATPTGAAVGSWLVPSVDRTWTITRPSGAGSGTTSSVCQVAYRRASDNVVLATQVVEYAITIA